MACRLNSLCYNTNVRQGVVNTLHYHVATTKPVSYATLNGTTRHKTRDLLTPTQYLRCDFSFLIVGSEMFDNRLGYLWLVQSTSCRGCSFIRAFMRNRCNLAKQQKKLNKLGGIKSISSLKKQIGINLVYIAQQMWINPDSVNPCCDLWGGSNLDSLQCRCTLNLIKLYVINQFRVH